MIILCFFVHREWKSVLKDWSVISEFLNMTRNIISLNPHHFYQIFTKFINYLIDKSINNCCKSSPSHSFIHQPRFLELHQFWAPEMSHTDMLPAPKKFVIELGSFQESWWLNINEEVLQRFGKSFRAECLTSDKLPERNFWFVWLLKVRVLLLWNPSVHSSGQMLHIFRAVTDSQMLAGSLPCGPLTTMGYLSVRLSNKKVRF